MGGVADKVGSSGGYGLLKDNRSLNRGRRSFPFLCSHIGAINCVSFMAEFVWNFKIKP